MGQYLQYLIWVMLFVIVLEMVFPDNSYKKYLKLVLGCILIYTILSPVVKVLHINSNKFDDYVLEYQQIFAMDNSQAASYDEELQYQEDMLDEIYEKSITTYIEENFNVEVYDIDVSFDNDAISSIDIGVRKPLISDKVGTIKMETKQDSIDGDEENFKNKLKTCLSDFYNVQVQNINIIVQKS